jgi:hypothetical protein
MNVWVRLQTRMILLTCKVLLCTLMCYDAQAQLADTMVTKKNNNIFRRAISAVQSGPEYMLEDDTIQLKSETPFLPYDGKGIRRITFEKYGFEKTFQDTSKGIKYFGTRILNSLHNNTKANIIKNNLFFREKTPLDAYLLADNERYLRTLDYIQDARILVTQVLGDPDSVDVAIVTKDFFSISFDLSQASPGRFKGKVSDANLFGMGQKLEMAVLLDKDRTPGFGYDLRYTKNNMGGSFINGTIGHTTINSNIGNGVQNEKGWYARLERPLVSATTQFAGAVSASYNASVNSFNMPDSQFYRYRYQSYDGWIGYNIGARKLLRNKSIQNRFFISMRYLNNHFSVLPMQMRQPFDLIFNSRQVLLSQFTFFRQNFYKTNYIYAFGTTEDVPYGYNVSIVSGWYKQLGLSRPYIGVDANRYIITTKGHIVQYYVRSGGFANQGKWEDAVFLVGASMFSRVFICGNTKVRQYLSASFTRQFNRRGLYPLDLNNDFGVPDFREDSLRGIQRMSIHSETSIFLKPKLFGFKFSPFAFGDVSLLSPENKTFSKSEMYYGIGGGVRTRNENLVFRTIELKLTYFPRRIQGREFVKIGISSNLRFRYNTSYVKAPDIVQVNSDAYNSIY